MSQRAAWQLERLGFSEVFDFVVSKSYWIASARPTIGRSGPPRVGEEAHTDVPTARPHETVDVVRDRSDGSDVVVVTDHGIVLGIARSLRISEADPHEPVGAIMRVGPTTVRPDEPLTALQKRMTVKSVPSVIVTKPTGELLGIYDSTETNQP